MSSFSTYFYDNNVTDINTILNDFENPDLYEQKYYNKWRVYDCKFCGWVFYSHDKSDLLRCVCCEYKIKFETYDCSDCRSVVEPDNCRENNLCKQFLCTGKIIKCNNRIGIYYKDWNNLVSETKSVYNKPCQKCFLPQNVSILISKNEIPSNICVNCYENNY